MTRLSPPNNINKILLHSCCAPCSCSIIERMIDSDIDLTIFYYNPNIYPQSEYEIRKNENKRFANSKNIPFVDADYDSQFWTKETDGMANEEERGQRCAVCFDIRFAKTAHYAHENVFPLFTSSLGISRWKDFDQVTRSAQEAAKQYPNLAYWDYNWRKEDGSQEMHSLSKEENFYKQEYCGCIYSLKSTNHHRESRGKPLIIRDANC